MSKIKIVVLLFLIIVVIACTAFFFRPLIYRSKEQIHSILLKDTPLGCNKKQIIDYVQAKNYTDRGEVQGAFEERMQPHRKIGNHYIQVYLGEYQGIPFKCNVTVFWVFDENEKLVHIDVWKDYDGL